MKKITEKTRLFFASTKKANNFLFEKGAKKQIFWLLVLSILIAQYWVLSSWLFGQLVNRISTSHSLFEHFPIYGVVLVIFAADIIFEITRFIKSFFQRKLGFILKNRVQKAYWYAFIKYDLQDRENKKMQDALGNANDNQNAIAEIFDSQLQIIVSIATLCTAMITLIAIQWWYALLVSCIVIPRLFFVWKRKNKEYKQDKQMQELYRYRGSLSSFLFTKDAMVHGAKAKILSLFDSLRYGGQKLSLRRSMFYVKISFFSNVWFYLIDATLLLSLVYSVASGKVAIGVMFVFFSAFMRLYDSLTDVTEKVMTIGVTLKKVDDFFLVATGTPAITDVENAISVDNAKTPLIEFRNVSFKYPDAKDWVLKNCTFKINSGERVGLVARNGEGKTTIALLLLRFYDVTEGAILINGIDIRLVKRETLLGITSILFQDFTLLQGSVRFALQAANFKNTYSDAELWDALEKVGMKDYVKNLPNGLDHKMSKIFADSRKFSGGQSQKIGIAGTVLRNPKLLILDEFTSALDPIAEAEMIRLYKEISIGKTCLIISHRYNTLDLVDKVIILQDGTIVEEGSKKQLLATEKGVFKELYKASNLIAEFSLS